MDDRQGRHVGASWWCWGLLAAAAMVLAPGAARMISPSSNAPVYAAPYGYYPAPIQNSPPTASPYLSANLQAAPQLPAPQVETAAPIAIDPVPLQSRDVEDLIQHVIQEQGGSRANAEQFLTHLLRGTVGVAAAEPNSNASTLVVVTATKEGESAKSHVAAMLNPRQLKSLDAALTLLRKHGFQQVQISARWISLPATMLTTKALSLNWRAEAGSDAQFPPSASFPGEFAAPDAASPWTRARSTARSNHWMMFAVLTDPEMKGVIAAVQSDADANLLTAPKVTVFNGQLAAIMDGVQRPFVVGLRKVGEQYQPQVKVFQEGRSLALRPLAKDKSILLTCETWSASITDVETMQLPRPAGKEPLSIQIPEVAEVAMQAAVEVPNGQTLAMVARDPADKTKLMMVLLTAQSLEMFPASEATPHQEPAAAPLTTD